MGKTLVAIAYHNGSQYLPQLLPSISPKYDTVIDTGSTAEERSAARMSGTRTISVCCGGCVAAYEYAFAFCPNYDEYFFMHDSMRAKIPEFVPFFAERGDVTAWIGFPMDYGGHEEFLRRNYGELNDIGNVGIFGPIFYATRRAMERIIFPPHVHNRDELCAMERGYAITFRRAGFEVNYLEEYDNERIDIKKDYRFFDKWRPNR